MHIFRILGFFSVFWARKKREWPLILIPVDSHWHDLFVAFSYFWGGFISGMTRSGHSFVRFVFLQFSPFLLLFIPPFTSRKVNGRAGKREPNRVIRWIENREKSGEEKEGSEGNREKKRNSDSRGPWISSRGDSRLNTLGNWQTKILWYDRITPVLI